MCQLWWHHVPSSPICCSREPYKIMISLFSGWSDKHGIELSLSMSGKSEHRKPGSWELNINGLLFLLPNVILSYLFKLSTEILLQNVQLVLEKCCCMLHIDFCMSVWVVWAVRWCNVLIILTCFHLTDWVLDLTGEIQSTAKWLSGFSNF